MIDLLAAGIYSKLTGGTALTALLAGTASVYHLQAPDNATLPYVVYNVQGGGDTNISPNRAKDLLVWVRAYTAESAKAAALIDNQVDALLHNGTITVTGWTNYWLARETDLATVENPPDGSKIYHAGGLYRVRLAQS
jgi:hypothetical protein